jgi:acetylornithine deacetylase
MSLHNHTTAVIDLLKELIAIQSFSKEEHATADRMAAFLQSSGIAHNRSKNNIWAGNRFYSPFKPTLLLNSHHDTVKPNPGYTRNPLDPAVEDGKLYGLGSNDAGGALVSLLAAFLHFYERDDLAFNLIYAATAEEEISGRNGIESIVAGLGDIDMAIVGEPTGMQMAVAERGLMVLDCVATGKTGHAANTGGVNAIYLAMKDIEWFRTYSFEKKSDWLGAVGMNVTVINAGQAHNQVPAECRFVVDVRLNECYTHQQALEIIRQHVNSEVKERSMRIKPSFINEAHAMVQAAQQLGITLFGSATTSDMALMPWPAVKIGPGISARSHSADEFIYVNEMEEGIKTYIKLIELYSAKTNTK